MVLFHRMKKKKKKKNAPKKTKSAAEAKSMTTLLRIDGFDSHLFKSQQQAISSLETSRKRIEIDDIIGNDFDHTNLDCWALWMMGRLRGTVLL